jgi:hypothetical protein
MKKLLILSLLATFSVACSGSAVEETTTDDQVETSLPAEEVKQLEEEQATNVELEQLDGELDSLLNTL